MCVLVFVLSENRQAGGASRGNQAAQRRAELRGRVNAGRVRRGERLHRGELGFQGVDGRAKVVTAAVGRRVVTYGPQKKGSREERRGMYQLNGHILDDTSQQQLKIADFGE